MTDWEKYLKLTIQRANFSNRRTPSNQGEKDQQPKRKQVKGHVQALSEKKHKRTLNT